MKFDDWLAQTTRVLDEAGIGTARLDALVLAEDLTQKDRAWLLAHPEHELDADVLEKLKKNVSRRALHEPLAYIRGKAEFYGREYTVNKDVLVPRPETETMIDVFKKLDLPEQCRVIDVGTGSGAIGITAVLERPGCTAVLLDNDPKCLHVAAQNSAAHGLELKIVPSDLLAEVNDAYDCVLANLPYVPDAHTINQAAMLEPKQAIFGGPDGLDMYRRMFMQIDESGASRRSKPRFVLTESLPFQHAELAKIANGIGYELVLSDDFIQVFTARD